MGIADVDFWRAFTAENHRDLRAVGTETGAAVRALEAHERGTLIAAEIDGENIRKPGLIKTGIDQPRAVRCPAGIERDRIVASDLLHFAEHHIPGVNFFFAGALVDESEFRGEVTAQPEAVGFDDGDVRRFQ